LKQFWTIVRIVNRQWPGKSGLSPMVPACKPTAPLILQTAPVRRCRPGSCRTGVPAGQYAGPPTSSDSLGGYGCADALGRPHQVRPGGGRLHTDPQVAFDVVEADAAETQCRLLFAPGFRNNAMSLKQSGSVAAQVAYCPTQYRCCRPGGPGRTRPGRARPQSGHRRLPFPGLRRGL
jgi:hypothetical protein